MHPYEVLRRPMVTEKSTALKDLNKYAFEVAAAANKNQVKEAVDKAFNVTVTSVNIVHVPGKLKRRGARFYETQEKKKALVTVKAGQKIEFFEGV